MLNVAQCIEYFHEADGSLFFLPCFEFLFKRSGGVAQVGGARFASKLSVDSEPGLLEVSLDELKSV